jgi:hypothetical protein
MTDKKPVVWIVNEAGHDFTKAARFGTLRAITTADVNPLNLDRLIFHVTKVVGRFTKPDDLLLVSGTPILTGIVLRQWLAAHPICNILQWNAMSTVRDYELSTITRENLDRLLEKELFH